MTNRAYHTPQPPITTSDRVHDKDQEPLLTKGEALEYLKTRGLRVTDQWLRRYSGAKIPFYKTSNRRYYRVSDIESFIASIRVRGAR